MKKICKVPVQLVLKVIYWICDAYVSWYSSIYLSISTGKHEIQIDQHTYEEV